MKMMRPASLHTVEPDDTLFTSYLKGFQRPQMWMTGRTEAQNGKLDSTRVKDRMTIEAR